MRLIRRQYKDNKDVNKNINISLREGAWHFISTYGNKLSEKFIEKYKDKVNWDYISIYHMVSESFIEKHKDKVNWFYASTYQILSEGFIENHKDVVNWICILTYQKLSFEFREKWKYAINKKTI